MSDFIKYPSLVNHYHEKTIKIILNEHPNLLDEKFLIFEKLDGANIQFYFADENTIKVGSRNQWIGEITRTAINVSSFYDLKGFLEENDLTSQLRAMLGETLIDYRLFGEFFGNGIQKRINYGRKSIRFFDVMCPENELINPIKAEEFLINHDLPSIPSFKEDTLRNILEQGNVDIISNYSDDLSEGFVIKPKNSVLRFGQGKSVIIKFKSDQFNEKSNETKKIAPKFSEGTLKWNLKFKELINDNRIVSVFSKYGPIENSGMIGQYIRYVLTDAKEEFLELYNDEFDVEENDQKKVFNVGGDIANLLKQHL